MKDIIDWVIKHWAELSAALGIGGASGFTAKKLTDKKQDAKITELEKKVGQIDKSLDQLKNDIAVNTMFDKQFREQVEREYNGIKESMTEIKSSVNSILSHLLDKK